MSQPSLVITTQNPVPTKSRRSTRVAKSVPLIILGQNRRGEPFMERTVCVSLNMHGCRYPSRHDYGVGSWVTLQVMALGSEQKLKSVRAVVRSVHPPCSPREIQQVRVELETPANVWGVEPLTDWLCDDDTNASVTQLAAGVAPALEPATMKVSLPELPMRAESMMAQLANFPAPLPASKPPLPKLPAPKPMEREYELFEELPDGSHLWHAHVSGLQNACTQLLDVAVTTKNLCFAMHLRTEEVVARLNSRTAREAVKVPLVFQIAYDSDLAVARSTLLRDRGYEVVSVVGNESARLVLSLPQRFDFFILGHTAPKEYRLDMVAWLKKHFPDTRILALSPPLEPLLTGADHNVKFGGHEMWLSIIHRVLPASS